MPGWLRSMTGLVALLLLTAVATPPVVEDHREIGFCSADCPVQHTGHGAAIEPPPVPSASHRAPVIVSVIVRGAEATLALDDTPDAPRAPPSA
jgi:hypothetical protein